MQKILKLTNGSHKSVTRSLKRESSFITTCEMEASPSKQSKRHIMKYITVLTLAAAGLAFAATPSYAQSSYGGNTGQSYGNSSSSQNSAALRRKERAAKKAAKAAAQREEAKAAMIKAEKAELAMKEKAMVKGHSSAKTPR